MTSEKETIVSSKKKKKIIKENNIPSDFTLKDVLDVGGTEEDFKLLESLNEDEEIVTESIYQLDRNLNSEIEAFVKEIGLTKFQGIQLEKIHASNDEFQKDKENKDIEVKETSEFKIESFMFDKREHILLKNFVPWYQKIISIPKGVTSLPEEKIDNLHELARKHWQDEVNLYLQMKEKDKSSDAQWLRTVLSSGTMSDKVAALTMITQESPIHSMKSLESLMNLAKKKSRREALAAVDSLRHIWIADLLPEIKLRNFNEYQLERLKELSKSGLKSDQIKLLIMMAFEHELKKMYEDFVNILQNLSRDPLVDIRNKVLGIVYEMLVMKPEQEQKLLSILVNKLGDPDRKVASKTSFLLSQLVSKHPNMQEIVIAEVERLLYRPNVSEKAQYYAIIFLNQLVLSHQKKHVATKLINIYFSYFKVVAKKHSSRKRNASDSQEIKLIAGLLTGVNRAFPYAKGEETEYEDQLNTLFKLTHMDHIGTSIQALMLIYQVMETRESVSDRYYQALYEKLLDPQIRTSSKHAMLLNILYKSLKNDPSTKRMKTFAKRLIQVAAKEQSSMLCGILFVLSEVMKSNAAVRSIIVQPEENEDDEEENFKDVPDPSEITISDDEDIEKTESPTEDKPKTESWTFINKSDKNKRYDIHYRNPLYAGAEYSSMWEIVPIVSHFHPSVEHFATSILNGQDIQYKGDPLQDFTLIRFLDRFMYRNPKKKDKDHGSSIMQAKEVSSRLREEPVNSKSFLNKSNVREDELFFYRYFKHKNDKLKKKEDEKERNNENDTDDEDDQDIFDFDFAGEMKKGREETNLKKRKKDPDDEGSDIDDDDDSVASYDMLDDDSFDEDEETKTNFTDKDYEKALFENLNSDGESIDEMDDNEDNENAKMSAGKNDNMFASVEEFAHMLDDDNEGKSSKGYMKQKQWEERNTDWKKNRQNRKRKFQSKNKNNQKIFNKNSERKNNSPRHTKNDKYSKKRKKQK